MKNEEYKGYDLHIKDEITNPSEKKKLADSGTDCVDIDDVNDLARCDFMSGHSYFAIHIPTGEDWYILGIDEKCDRVCVAGYPATIGKLSDCKEFEKNKPLELSEIEYRTKTFGQNWL